MVAVGTIATAVAGFFELLFACIFAIHKCKKEEICCFASENSESSDSQIDSFDSENIELSLIRHESKQTKELNSYHHSLKKPLLDDKAVESSSGYIYETCLEALPSRSTPTQ